MFLLLREKPEKGKPGLQIYAYIKAGARLWSELTMSVHLGLWVLHKQVGHQSAEGCALLWSSGIFGRLAVSRKTSDVADAYAMGIVPLTMCSGLGDGASCVYCAVAVNDVVIADALPASFAVPAVYVSHGEVLAFGCGGAVDDDFSDFSHIVVVFRAKGTGCSWLPRA